MGFREPEGGCGERKGERKHGADLAAADTNQISSSATVSGPTLTPGYCCTSTFRISVTFLFWLTLTMPELYQEKNSAEHSSGLVRLTGNKPP